MMNQIENHVSGNSPFKPDFEPYLAAHPGRGSLRVQVSAANQSFPVKDVFVDVAVLTDGVRYSLYHDVTNSSGVADQIVLPCCMGSDNNSPETAGKNDAVYLVSIYHPDFEEIIDFPVIVQDHVETILPVALKPLNKGMEV